MRIPALFGAGVSLLYAVVVLLKRRPLVAWMMQHANVSSPDENLCFRVLVTAAVMSVVVAAVLVVFAFVY